LEKDVEKSHALNHRVSNNSQAFWTYQLISHPSTICRTYGAGPSTICRLIPVFQRRATPVKFVLPLLHTPHHRRHDFNILI